MKKDFEEVFTLPEMMRDGGLQNTAFYPFKDERLFPQNNENRKNYFPNEIYEREKGNPSSYTFVE